MTPSATILSIVSDHIRERTGRVIIRFAPEDLAAAFHYDPQTGVLRNKTDRASNCRAGDVAGSLRKDGYLTVRFRTKPLLAHRVAFAIHHGWMPDEIDHIDGDRRNNRADNLRATTRSENRSNTPAQRNSRLGVKGVTQKKSGKYAAYIQRDYHLRHLGTFATIEEAKAARDAAARELHGEFFHA